MCPALRADDVGWINARLIELPGQEYIFEVDVVPQMVGVLGKLLAPRRFVVARPEYRRQGALMNVRYLFKGGTLRGDDVLLLPWNRMGVIVTARWIDGTQSRTLFMRRSQGIPVEIHRLRPVVKGLAEVFFQTSREGLFGLAADLAAWLFVFALVVVSASQPAGSLFLLFSGWLIALVLSDLFVPQIPPLAARCLLLIAALLSLRARLLFDREPVVGDIEGSSDDAGGARDGRWSSIDRRTLFAPVFLLAGWAFGVSRQCILSTDATLAMHSPTAVLGDLLGASLFWCVLGMILTFVANALRNYRLLFRSLLWVAGGITITCLLLTLSSPPELEEVNDLAFEPLPASSSGSARPGGAATAPTKLENPLAIYLVVEPHEVRCEVLASAAFLVEEFGIDLKVAESISVEEQAELSALGLSFVEAQLRVDFATRGAVDVRRVDFLTLSASGPVVRAEPVLESSVGAVMGFTFVYATAGPPDEVTVEWTNLPASIEEIPLTFSDPYGARGATFSGETRSLRWEKQPGSFRLPEVHAVEVSRPSRAIPSGVILLIVSLLWLFRPRGASNVRGAAAMVIGVLLAAGLYPFARVSFALPFEGRVMSKDLASETIERLLENVYRSFSFRDEGAIYDRLAICVVGDQLTDIYIEQRRALELAHRGGARARVDEVDVLRVDSVVAEPTGGLAIRASWIVGGSVQHFGHTHYRRNRYSAVLHLLPVDGRWKIADIDVEEERRVL